MKIISACFTVLYFLSLVSLVSCKGNEPEKASAYITDVFEYVYAPGQHATIAKPADISNFVGEPNGDKGFLYLGGFGGYVVAGFDHNVANSEGPDFEVYALKGASPEPAVVYVMSDSNGNGKPDETWYELKGNRFADSERGYWVRYYKAQNPTSNITWVDSKGRHGELIPGYGATHSAAWWWPATTSDSITLSGTRLPDAFVNDSQDEAVQHWIVPADRFTWGYAKNLYGTDYDTALGSNKLDIANAVNSAGNAVSLTTIRFIKVQTAVFQQAGWLNEVSTEVRGAKDMHQ